MTPQDAVAAPRIHCEGGPVLLECARPPPPPRALAARGRPPAPRPFAYDSLQGRIQLVVATATAGPAPPTPAGTAAWRRTRETTKGEG